MDKPAASSSANRYKPISVRLEEASVPEPNSGCWLWLMGVDGGGYGTIKVQGRMKKAHRLSYMVYRDMIPKGMKVLHRCDIPSCINPDHLFLGTQADNVRDMFAKGRQCNSRGERNGNSKLTAEDAAAIRQSTERCVVLGARYGISATMVSNIRTGKHWK